jgi:hypothetical protein
LKKETSVQKQCVFLGVKYQHLVTKKRGDPTNVFWGKNSKTLPYLEGKNYKSPDLDQSSKHITKM